MRLHGKKLLMLVSDGVDLGEYEQIRHGFEGEGAEVLITTPQHYAVVETVSEGRRGRDILIDVPFDAVGEMKFSGVIIPDGLLSTDGLLKDRRVLELLFSFHQQGLPVFASGNAVRLLYESHILSEQIVVREGSALPEFISQAIGVMLDYPLNPGKYRPSIQA